MVELSPTHESGQFQKAFAGDTLNTLWYVRQLCPDWGCRYVSRVGQDQISDDMVAMMVGAGVQTDHVQRDKERTVGLYMISLAQGERSFAYWRGQSAARHLADDPTLVAAAIADVDVVFISGITLAILEDRSRASLLQILAAARDDGKTIVFDPNLRPRLWSGVAPMRDAIMAGASVSNMVLPSFDEEALHFGDASIEATAGRYQSAGAEAIVVKNGPGAAYFVHGSENGTVMPAQVRKVVDTTSAGDSFNAGVLAGLGRSGTMAEAIALGCAVARQVINQKGALVRLKPGAVDRESRISQ